MMCELDASVGTCGLTGLIETTTTTFEFDISPHLYAVTVTAGAELLDGAAATEPSSSGDEVGGGGDDGAEDAAPLLGSGRSVIVAALVAVSVAGLL
jgi:hypothetical protein